MRDFVTTENDGGEKKELTVFVRSSSKQIILKVVRCSRCSKAGERGHEI
jgi:hypothetical protein